MSSPCREMTLAEWVGTLPLLHPARDEFAKLAAVAAERDALESMRQAVFERDAKDGCCAPGEWCCFKPYSQLAVEHAEALKRIAATEAERDAAVAEREEARADRAIAYSQMVETTENNQNLRFALEQERAHSDRLQRELTAARAEAGEIAASVREHLDWIEVACIGGGFQHNMTCQETLGLVLDHARLAKSALDRKGAGL